MRVRLQAMVRQNLIFQDLTLITFISDLTTDHFECEKWLCISCTSKNFPTGISGILRTQSFEVLTVSGLQRRLHPCNLIVGQEHQTLKLFTVLLEVAHQVLAHGL